MIEWMNDRVLRCLTYRPLASHCQAHTNHSRPRLAKAWLLRVAGLSRWSDPFAESFLQLQLQLQLQKRILIRISTGIESKSLYGCPEQPPRKISSLPGGSENPDSPPPWGGITRSYRRSS